MSKEEDLKKKTEEKITWANGVLKPALEEIEKGDVYLDGRIDALPNGFKASPCLRYIPKEKESPIITPDNVKV